MENKRKINYLGIILGIILNVLVIITSILIYNAYIVNPKIKSNLQYNAIPSSNNKVIDNVNGASSTPR